MNITFNPWTDDYIWYIVHIMGMKEIRNEIYYLFEINQACIRYSNITFKIWLDLSYTNDLIQKVILKYIMSKKAMSYMYDNNTHIIYMCRLPLIFNHLCVYDYDDTYCYSFCHICNKRPNKKPPLTWWEKEYRREARKKLKKNKKSHESI